MSNVDFQNGFICGMATKGLTRSGEYYKPIVWNDDGVYNYFYIDFKKSMDFFSIGMFNSSIIIYSYDQLDVYKIEQISSTTYKIYCDLSNKPAGITILNKKTSLLSFVGRMTLPVFSIHMYIQGQEKLEQLKYIYDMYNYQKLISDVLDNINIVLRGGRDIGSISESSITNTDFIKNIVENVNIVLS